jgi:hypothetical protein
MRKREVTFEKCRPHRLPASKQKETRAKWDKPGCCDAINCVVHWNGTHWVHEPDNAGCGLIEMEVCYCPFCGTKLDNQTPAKR